ncbi:intracellular multiplication protein IcmE [Oxalobacteraceae bacterium GrIS 1.11]
MSTIQADIGRQSKVLLIGSAVALLAVGYIVATYQEAAAARQSSAVAIEPGHGTPAPESEHYGDVLNRYNKKNAATAGETGETYVSVLSSRSSSVAAGRGTAEAPQQAPAPQAATQPAAPAPQPTPRAPQVDQRLRERIGEQAQALMVNWTPISHTESRSGEAGEAARTVIAAHGAAPAGAAPANAVPQRLIEDFEPIPAILETEIDTDENSIVSAFIPSRDYAGAKLFAMGYKRINNTVDLSFTSMKWKGRSYKINAKALDKDSLRSALSGEVNHRYFSRIIIPALAMGLGRAGQLFEQADTQTVVTPFGTVVRSQSGPPSGKAVAGTILGGAAQQAGQVLSQEAAQEPVKQVIVARNETIGILFLEPVLSTAETPAPAPRQ